MRKESISINKNTFKKTDFEYENISNDAKNIANFIQNWHHDIVDELLPIASTSSSAEIYGTTEEIPNLVQECMLKNLVIISICNKISEKNYKNIDIYNSKKELENFNKLWKNLKYKLSHRHNKYIKYINNYTPYHVISDHIESLLNRIMSLRQDNIEEQAKRYYINDDTIKNYLIFIYSNEIPTAENIISVLGKKFSDENETDIEIQNSFIKIYDIINSIKSKYENLVSLESPTHNEEEKNATIDILDIYKSLLKQIKELSGQINIKNSMNDLLSKLDHQIKSIDIMVEALKASK